MRTIAFISLFILSTTLFSQNYIGKQKEIDRILSNISDFSEAVMRSDAQAIGMAYTEDAKIFPSNTDIIRGREAIIEYWTLPDGVQTTYHKIRPEEIKINGKEAYDYGYYEGTTRRADGSESSWRGKYVIIWKKLDGEWKIYLDIWNNIRR